MLRFSPRTGPCLEPLQVQQAALPASRRAQSSPQASQAWQGYKRKALPSPRNSSPAGRRQAVRVGELPVGLRPVLPEAGPWAWVWRQLFFAGLPREGGPFFAGLSLGDSFFTEPLSGALRLGAYDERFFLAGNGGGSGFGLSPPRPNRRCKKCNKPGFFPSLMALPGRAQPQQ